MSAEDGSGRPSGEGRLLQLVYYGYVAGSRLALALPERFAYGAAHSLGSVGARLSPKKRTVALNLARITGRPVDSPEVEALTREAFRSYARYWLETFRLIREDAEFFLTRFLCVGEHKIDAVLGRGKGALVVVGHLGNWDAAGAWAGARGNTLVTVAEVLRPRRMFDFFAAHRARLGMVIHPAQPGVTDKLVAAIEEGAVVAILGDRDLKGTGPEVDFFGARVNFPAGPASVALRAGVPILVAGVGGAQFADGRRGWLCEISDPIELPERRDGTEIARLTQQTADQLQRFVAKFPAEWHVFQPFWKEDRQA
ncbi:MAG: phosphatidylinositol mannoside acyltransferase [Actinomycetota bacterium]|nr:phosphatidylinositol mannoside acyltransferase [Actinomycetota bacterium]